jgi:hypothetical protein
MRAALKAVFLLHVAIYARLYFIIIIIIIIIIVSFMQGI